MDTSDSDTETSSNSDLMSMVVSTSRIPFTSFEISRLTNLIEEKKKIFENKRADFMTQSKKQQAWISLTRVFNSSAEVRKRTVKQL
jgi:hypothetical protein